MHAFVCITATGTQGSKSCSGASWPRAGYGIGRRQRHNDRLLVRRAGPCVFLALAPQRGIALFWQARKPLGPPINTTAAKRLDFACSPARSHRCSPSRRSIHQTPTALCSPPQGLARAPITNAGLTFFTCPLCAPQPVDVSPALARRVGALASCHLAPTAHRVSRRGRTAPFGPSRLTRPRGSRALMATVSLSPTLSVMSSRRAPLTSNPNVVNSPLRGAAALAGYAKQKRSHATVQREEAYGQPPPVKKQALENGSQRPIRSPPSRPSPAPTLSCSVPLPPPRAPPPGSACRERHSRAPETANMSTLKRKSGRSTTGQNFPRWSSTLRASPMTSGPS